MKPLERSSLSSPDPVRRGRRLSYANVVSTLALVLVVSGGGAAVASHLVVRSSDIVNGQVKTSDLAGGAVTTSKLAAKAVTADKRAATPQAKVAYNPANPGVTVPNTTGTVVPFNVQEFDTGSMWVSGSGDRITINRAGTYLAVGEGVWQSGQGGGTERNLCVTAKDATNMFLDNSCQRVVPATGWTQSQHLPLVIQLDKGDYLQLSAYQDRGASANLLDPRLAVIWLGPKS